MIARLFPRLTAATPDDGLAFFDVAAIPPKVSEIHVSVTFSYDLKKAEEMAKLAEKIAPTSLGGPATGDRGGDFIPGRYLRRGYVITSRGCPNRCWFCDVWKREGSIRELPITDGWNVLDSNLLACSEQHVRGVFEMLARQNHRVQFTGGLEAKRLQPWHIGLLWYLRPEQIFFAYDTEDDYEPLVKAGREMYRADFTRRHCRCYVLIGFPKDTKESAEKRLIRAWKAGFMPMAMLWKDRDGNEDAEWRQFQRTWARPAITRKLMRDTLFPRKG